MIIYNFQEDIFENINTPEKAYWLGFLYADGFIQESDNGIGVALKEEDKKQLLNFERFLNIDKSCLKYSEKTKSWKFFICRKKTYLDLINIGFSSKKSYDTTTIVWDNIPQEYKKDFLLGLWDGDGSFYFTGQNAQGASLISNNDNLIQKIVEYINLNIETNFCKMKLRTPGDPYPRIVITCNKAKIFGDWLYSNINYPTLTRKYNIYAKMRIGSRNSTGWDNSKTKGIYCIESKQYYITAKECALAEFGVENPGTINSIRAVCRGEKKQTKGKSFRYITEEEREWMKKWN